VRRGICGASIWKVTSCSGFFPLARQRCQARSILLSRAGELPVAIENGQARVANLRQSVSPARNHGGSDGGRVKRSDGGHGASCWFNRFMRNPPRLTAWVEQAAAGSAQGSSPCLKARIGNEKCF
jgi:hypothetical protein